MANTNSTCFSILTKSLSTEQHFLNLFTPKSDEHAISPYNIHYINQQTGNENTLTYQVEVFILIFV